METSLITYPAADFKERLKERERAIVVLENNLVSIHHIKLPPMTKFRAEKACAYALTEQLLSPQESLIYLVVRSRIENHWNVHVVSQEVVQKIENLAAETKTKIQALISENILLEPIKGAVTYFQKGDFITYITETEQGGRLFHADFEKLFSKHKKISVEQIFDKKRVAKFNLLKPRALSVFKEKFLRWRRFFVILFVIYCLSLTKVFLENNATKIVVNTLHSENRALFLEVFPTVSRIVDLHAQSSQLMNVLENQTELLRGDFLSQLAPINKNGEEIFLELIFEDKKLTITKN